MGKPRRSWSRAEKTAIVAESLAPGVRIKDVMRRHGISSGLFYTWRRALQAELGLSDAAQPFAMSAPASPPMQFMPLAITTEAPATTIEIAIGRARMKITGAMDPASIAALVKALAGATK